MKKLLVLSSTALILGACATAQAPVSGGLFTSAKMGMMATENTVTTKEGQACASSILGIVGLGDASIAAAKREAGIKKVSTVDYSSTSILGLYAQVCTVVTGE